MTQVNEIPVAPVRRDRSHLRLVPSLPVPEPARLAVPFEMRDHLAHQVAAALDGLALAEADGVQAVADAAAEDAAYLLNQLIDLLVVHHRTTTYPARQAAMRMARARMTVRGGERQATVERREQVLSLLREGLSSEAIAVRLGVSLRTVERHKHKAGLTRRTSVYDEWAPRILDHMRAFPHTEFTISDLSRVLRAGAHSKFKWTIRRLEREGLVVAVLGIRDPGSPTVKVTRWRLALEQEGGDGCAEA